MTQQYLGLAAIYRRRAWGARLTGAVLTTNLMLALAPAQAQESGVQVTQTAGTQSGTATTVGTVGPDGKPTAGKASAATAGKTKPAANGKQANKTAAQKKPAAGTKSVTPGVTIVPVPTRAVPAMPQTGVPPVLPGGALPPNVGGRPFGGGRDVPGGTTFTFDFHGSDIDQVLKFFSNMSNLTITKDPGLTGPVTIINPKSVTLNEAFRILQSVLYVRGFTAIQSSGVLQILPFRGAKAVTGILNAGINEYGPTLVDARNQFMTQVIPVENTDVSALARDLKELASPDASIIASTGTNTLIITDTASNVSRFIALVEALDKTSNKSELKIYSLVRSDASTITAIINDLYTKISPRGGGGQPGQPGQPPQPNQAPASPGRPTVVAVADPSTNSVLVVAAPSIQESIARDIIGKLDGDDNNRLETQTRKINYSDAQAIADLVNSVLSNQRPGQGASQNPSLQSRIFGGGGFGGFGGGFGGGGGGQVSSSSDPFGKIIADPRTNSVLITATKDRMDRINTLIDGLDKEVPFEPTTFVFQLKNAQAQDIAYSLGQAFGTSSSGLGQNNSFFSFGGGGNSSSNRTNGPSGLQGNTQRRQGTTTNPFGRGAGRNNFPPGPPNAPDQSGATEDPNIQNNGGSALPQGIQGVMTDQGFVPNEAPGDQQTLAPRTRQGGFFGGGFGGGRQRLGQSSSPQFGPGRNGSYANLLQLQGNVFVTPSPTGDSVIITTLPGNYEAVRQIIEALDIVPRQVMIEVIVAEVTLSDDQKLGFSAGGNFIKLFNKNNTGQTQVNAQSGSSGTAFDPLAQGAQFVLNGTNYSALLQALTTDNKTKVLATPRVFASNNQQASINIVQKVPYGISTVSGLSNFVITSPQFAQVGLQLQVTPRITRQGLVTIDVQQEADDLVRFQQIGTGPGSQNVPVVNQRSTDTEVTIQDGQTVVIGGLIRTNSSLNLTKIPILSDIPLIGQFFRSHEKTHDRTELMIFMTPHVINTVEEAKALALKEGAPLIKEIPELSQQQPNLTLPQPPKGSKIDPKTLPKDSVGKPYYPGTTDKDVGKGTGTKNGTGTGTNSGTGNGTGGGTSTSGGFGTDGNGTSGGTTNHPK